MSLVQEKPAVDRGRVLTTAVIRAAELLGVSDARLARILQVSRASVSRMRSAQRSISESGAEWQLGALFVRLYRSLDALIGGDDGKAARWLKAPNQHLGAVPIERIENIEGLVDVVQYLDAMRGRI